MFEHQIKPHPRSGRHAPADPHRPRDRIFGLLDHEVFGGFARTTFMSANLERTLAHRLLCNQGCSFSTDNEITSRLDFHVHENGELLTIYYAMKGKWSKHQREKRTGSGKTVGQVVIDEAKVLFGKEEFVWQTNIDVEKTAPFLGTNGIQLPHTAHGLNQFRHIHNAVVIPALNPSPALYGFLEQIAHIDPDEVQEGIYHESVYQTAGRISTRDRENRNPKRVVVADYGAAAMLADLYPGAKLVPLPCVDAMPEKATTGRRRKHESDSVKNATYRARHKGNLLAELESVNQTSAMTKLPNILGQNVIATSGYFGGSIWLDVNAKSPIDQVDLISVPDFIEFLRDLHVRVRTKNNRMHWSPAMFSPTGDTNRAIADIKEMYGVWLDCDNGRNMSPRQFSDLLPHVLMVIYNTATSTLEKPKYRVVIPTMCAITPAVHDELMSQIKDVLRRKGYYDKYQLQERAEKGRAGIDHGFEWKHVASMYGLPAQAEAGPEASFFHVFDGCGRQAIDPFNWIDRTIINHRMPVEDNLAAISADQLRAISQSVWQQVSAMTDEELASER